MKEYKIRIELDPDPMDPRKESDSLGAMVCFHKRYNLGDEHDYRSEDYDGWDEAEEAICKEEGAAVCLRIYGYDHGGLTIRTAPFSCPWDSGTVGFILVSKDKVRKEYGWKRLTKKRLERIEQYLRNEVEIYDQYLTGNVYGYILEDEDEEHVDSCWGFFGREYCEEAAEASKKWYEDEDLKQSAKRTQQLSLFPCCQP